MHYNSEIAVLPKVDVAIAGGGVAGTFAALGAAGEGAVVALIEEHSFLGGQGSAGEVHTFCGETRVVNDDWRRMLDRLGSLNGIARYRPNADGRAFDTEALKFVLQEMVLAAGVRLYLHTRLVDVVREDSSSGESNRRLDGLVVHNKSGLQYMPAGYLIDATGDADIVARAGLEFQKGGRALSPGETPTLDTDAGLRQLPMSLYFTLLDTGGLVAPVLPADGPTFADDEDLPMITLIPNGRLIAVKMKVIGHDVTDGSSLSAAEVAGRRQMMGVIYHLQTKGYRGRTYETYRLSHVAPHMGIREGRRVTARYVLSVDDILAGRHHDDAVAVGSYHVDYHWPNVVQRAGTGVTTQCPPYQIPLSAMRPGDCDNLLVPGRCLSGEQMAMSSFRVMGTCAQTGFGAGVAAGLACKSGGADPESHVGLNALETRELQRRLRDRGVRLDLAPYGNYLRFRRAVRETLPMPVASSPSAFAVTLLPSGAVVAAVAEHSAASNDTTIVRVLRRWEESWHEVAHLDVRSSARATAHLVFELDEPWRIIAEGIEEAGDGARREPELPSRVTLRVLEPGAETADKTDREFESVDDGVTWTEGESKPQAPAYSTAATDWEIEIALSPGDPATRVSARSSSGVVEVSSDGEWRRVPNLDLAAASPPAGLAPDPTGLLVLYQAAKGGTVFARVPIDALPLGGETEKEPMAGDWHHDDRSWIELLKEPAEQRR